jgi:GNAT superfamily N-acetyltransferase
MLNWKPQYSLYKKLSIPEIQDLNVVPELRRKGIASALITRCEELILQKGQQQVGIAVGLTPEYGAAQVLYVKAGYVPDGYGVTYDREGVRHGDIRPLDDDLCLMMVKEIKKP